MPNLKDWIQAIRPRTLPLSISGILTGLALSPNAGTNQLVIFWGCIFTALLFQILSNLANDLGDSQKGSDNENRIGPKRTIQQGLISQRTMRLAVWTCSLTALISACVLIYAAYKHIGFSGTLLYFILACLSILAAILYTIGKKAYGYLGLGDLMVFLFFGILAVLGTKHLYSNEWNLEDIFAAIAMGAWGIAVINLNNMRDQVNDKACKKNTLVVYLGFQRSKIYHLIILTLATFSWFSLLCLVFQRTHNPYFAFCLLPFPFLIIHSIKVIRIKNPKDFDPELKKVALSCFSAALSFFLCQLLLA